MVKIIIFAVSSIVFELVIFLAMLHFIWKLSLVHGIVVLIGIMGVIASRYSKELAIDEEITRLYTEFLKAKQEQPKSED